MTVQLLQGDCGDMVQYLPPAAAALVYLDPPFCTQKVHKMRDGAVAFPDVWSSLTFYVNYWAPRVRMLWGAVAPGGSLVLHVDPRSSHHFKVALDQSLGRENFASELVWRYRRWPTKTRNFQRVHDVLLRWVKPGAAPTWNQLYEPLAASTVETWGTSRQRAVTQDGKRVRSSATAEASPGVPMGDVWDISIVAPVSSERTGYPTQKPEALLERLVQSVTNPGDIVVDACFGSGTTLAVAARLGRHAVGIDESPVAHRITSHRLGISQDGTPNGETMAKTTTPKPKASLSETEKARIKKNTDKARKQAPKKKTK